MRLQRLDLTRYGKFTDRRIDFGERVAGRPDLHVIYGPNEAGKSTTLAAVLDLLFGIEKNSGYAFIHSYATLRIGAVLEGAGGSREVARIKRPQNSLLDASGLPVAEAGLLADLGGIDRHAYRDMFSLDDATLEEGGENILASKGDLGELLFSASAGVADLSRSLGAVKAEAELFFKTSRTGALAEFKRRLEDLKAKRAAIDTRASEHAALVKARDKARGAYDGTLASRGSIQARIEEIERHLNALPRLAALRRLATDLAAFAGLSDPPPHWGRDLPGLQREAVELGVKARALADEIERIETTLETLVVDDAALAESARVDELAPLRARYVTADKDLPDRRQRLRDAEVSITSILRRIEREDEPDPQRLTLGASVTGRLRRLLESRSGVDAALRAATAEGDAARRRLDAAAAKLRAASEGVAAGPARDAAFATLAVTLKALRSDDHAVRLRLADRALAAGIESLTERLRALGPWTGDAASLARLDCPDPDTLARWTAALAAARTALDRKVEEAERQETERRRLEAERDALVASTGLVTDVEAAGVRHARDQAWTEHRQRLDGASADRFEATLRADDAVMGRRFGHVVDLARLNQVSQALAVAQVMASRATEVRDAAAAVLQRVEAEIAGAVRSCAVALDGMSLSRFEIWLMRRQQALEAATRLAAAQADRRQALDDADAARARLSAALRGMGLPVDPEAGVATLLAAAEAASDRETALRALAEEVAERTRAVDERARASEEAWAAERAWDAAWAETCASCWLGEGGRMPAVETVREVLPALADLASALKERAGLADRVRKMDEDQRAFGEAVRTIARTLGIASPRDDFAALVAVIDERIRLARSQSERRAVEAQRLHDARDAQRDLAATLDIHRRRAGEMTAHFGVETLADVAQKLRDAERRADLKRQAEDAERDILDRLRTARLTEAEAILDGADRAALEAERAELQARFTDLDQRCRDLFVEQSRAIDAVEAIGGDAKVAELDELRRTTLLEIEEGALHYLKLRVGAVAADQALRLYRDRHRSSMMARASEAFRTISRGAYAGLSTQPADGGDTLIALVGGGGSKKADELSKGTRFQLYLALRVAGYYEFAKSRPPVPFLADDIMETFDDFRAEEAFRLFAGMAEVGQVIYLTHHRHLCEIARAVCPAVRIHDIGAPPT